MPKIVSHDDNAFFLGHGAADTFVAYGDNAILVGGGGNDTYYIKDSNISNGDSTDSPSITEDAAGGTADRVIYQGDYSDFDGITLSANVENLSLSGWADYGVGNEGNNVIDSLQLVGQNYWSYGPTINLFGEGGNDVLLGGDVNDRLDGGTGNDTLTGGAGYDQLYGGEGNDILNGGLQSDNLYAGDGNDTLNGGDDTLVARDGNTLRGGGDSLYGGDGNDTLNGGNDTLSSESIGGSLYAGSDLLYGGEGIDVLNGGNDVLAATDPNGYVNFFYAGNDFFYGGDGNDTINGGDDRLTGGNNVYTGEKFYASGDTYYGGYGNDTINMGDVTVLAGGGDDVIYGGLGGSFYAGAFFGDGFYAYGSAAGGWDNDTINGGTRTLDGGAGDDFIMGVGDTMDDRVSISGGYGADVINGPTMVLRGGTGSDRFYAGSFTFYGDTNSGAYSHNGYDGNDTIRGGNITVDGGAGDDVMYAGYTQMFYGGGGNDTIVGGSLTFLGGAGNDQVYTEGYAFQRMYGGYGNDTMTAGNVVITDAVGDNHVYGDYGRGVGYAAIYGGLGNDVANGANGSDWLEGGEGNDALNGNAGNDTLVGGYGNDNLNGGVGNDVLAGDDGTDTLNGGAGDDKYYVSWYGGTDSIVDSAGDDTVMVYNGTFTAAAGIENIVDTGYGYSSLTGNASDNYIYGGGSADILIGLAGNDVLNGGEGADRMEGGAGNDSYIVDSAGDLTVEAAGAGTDSVFVKFYGYGQLQANVENMTLSYGAGETTIFGNALNNVLTGNGYANVIYGGAGNDTLIDGLDVHGNGTADIMFGGTGNDTYILNYGYGSVYELNGGGIDTVRVAVHNHPNSFTLGQNVENLVAMDPFGYGFAGFGNDLANRIEGGAGSDLLFSGGGNVALADTLIGGAGSDRYFVDSLNDVVTEVAGGGTSDTVNIDTTATSGTFTLLAEVENGVLYGSGSLNLTGNAGNNNLSGNNGANVLDGAAGNDFLYGGGGNDILLGGAGNDFLDGEQGNDRMEGGLGNDTYIVNRGDGAGTAISVAGTEDVVVDTGGIDTVISHVYTYTLDTTIENLVLDDSLATVARKGFGNGLDNKMYGNSLANTLDGAAGNDRLFGGDGNDSLTGGAGNDYLDGGSGNDTLTGGAGNDIYIVDSNGDSVVEGASAGTDLVRSFVNYSLESDVENLTLYGGATSGSGNGLNNVITGSGNSDFLYGGVGNDSLVGNAGDDYLYGATGNDTLLGGAGNDTMVGGVGNDNMTGGTGDDLYYINSLSDVVVEAAGGGTDGIRIEGATGALTLTLGATFENGFAGNNGQNHIVVGNALNNHIVGSYGSNVLSGGAGNDQIFGSGNSGNGSDLADTLNGGDGNDLLDGGYGNDTLNGDAGDDGMFGGSGNDVLNGGTGNDYLDGGSDSDVMDGGAGDDDLYGGSGNDAMTGGAGNDTLDGGSGTNTFTGGAGDDIYRVRSFSDTQVELAGGGTDAVYVYRTDGVGSVTLSANVENLLVVGGALSELGGYGNGLANEFEVDQLVSGDYFDGSGGIDTFRGSMNYSGNTDGSVDLFGFETTSLQVSLSSDEDWAVHAGAVTGQVVNINGAIGGTSSLTVDQLAATHTVNLGTGTGGHLFGALTLAVAVDGVSDVLNMVLGNTADGGGLQLTTLNVETLNFKVQGADNQLNLVGVTGQDLIHFTGNTSSLEVGGLGSADLIQLQNFAVDDLSLYLSVAENGYHGSDSLSLDVDNAVIGGLNTNDIDNGYGLENLIISTRGDPGFANGGSYIDFTGVDAETDIFVYGGQDLTAVNLGGGTVDMSGLGLTGDLNAQWRDGVATEFTAGQGNDHVYLADMNDTLIFGDNLDGLDVVNGGADVDTLSATFVAGTYTLHIMDVENLNFDVGSGATSFDLGDITGSSATVDIDLSGSGAVTFTLADILQGTEYDINASALTGSGSLNASTGSGHDTLVGTDNADTLNGGGNSDTLTGGGSADMFVFNNIGTGVDEITDFNAAQNDTIALSLSVFGEIGTVGSPMAAGSFVAGTAALDADDHVIYDVTTGSLYYDADGAGGDAQTLIATLDGVLPALTAANITVIA